MFFIQIIKMNSRKAFLRTMKNHGYSENAVKEMLKWYESEDEVKSLRKNVVKVMRNYIKERRKEKRSLNTQIERLDAQLQENAIDQNTYERLRAILEINYLQKQDDAFEEAFPE